MSRRLSRRGLRDPRGIPDRRDPRGNPENGDRQEIRDRRVILASRDPQDRRDRRDPTHTRR